MTCWKISARNTGQLPVGRTSGKHVTQERADEKGPIMENTDGLILDIRRKGMPLRRIADMAQCSTDHVQDVLKRHR